MCYDILNGYLNSSQPTDAPTPEPTPAPTPEPTGLQFFLIIKILCLSGQ